MHKTGTSAIQASLQHNELALNRLGYWQPDRLGRTDGGFQKVASLINRESPQAFIDHLKQVPPGQTAIVSAENLTHLFIRMGAELARLISRTFDTTVVVFLRRQDFMLESAFAQVVKYGPAANIESFNGYPFNYAPLMRVLWNGFGETNVKAILYRDDARTNSWGEFCAALELPELPLSRSNDNRSLHRRKTLLLSQVAIEKRRIGIQFFDMVQSGLNIEDDGQTFLSTPRRRESLVRESRNANVKICEKHGLDVDYMTACSGCREWFPAAEITPKEWRATLTAAVTQCDLSTSVISQLTKRVVA